MVDPIDIVVRDRIQASISTKLTGIGNAASIAQSRLTALRRTLSLTSGGFSNFIGGSARAVSGLKQLEIGVANTAQKFRTFASGLLLLGATGGIASQVDSYRTLQNQLRGVTDSQAQLNLVTEKIFDIAQRARVPIDDLGKSYRRFDIALAAAGRSQQESLDITETVAKALTLSGATAGEAASALLQLSQAFNKGKLDGDEFRSIAENIPAIMDAISQATGKSRTELFKMSRDGKLNINVLIDAFKIMKQSVDKDFADLPRTAGQAFTQLFNTIKFEFGKFAESSGFIDAISNAFDRLRENIETVGRALLALGAGIGVILGSGFVFWVVSLLGPLASISTAVATAVTYFTYFSNRITIAGEGTATLSSFIKVLVGDIYDLVTSSNALGDFFTVENAQKNLNRLIALLGKLRDGFNLIVASAAGVQAAMGNLFSESGEAGKVIRFTTNVIALAKTMGEVLPLAIKSAVEAFNTLKTIGEIVLRSLFNQAKATVQSMLELSKSVVEAVPGGKYLSGPITAAQNMLNAITFDGVVDMAKQAGEDVAKGLTHGLDLYLEAAKNDVAFVLDEVNKMIVEGNPMFAGMDEVEKKSKSTADVFAKAYGEAYSKIKTMEDQYLQSVKERAKAMDDAVQKTEESTLKVQGFGTTVDQAKEKVKGFGNAFNEADQKVQGFGNSFKNSLRPEDTQRMLEFTRELSGKLNEAGNAGKAASDKINQGVQQTIPQVQNLNGSVNQSSQSFSSFGDTVQVSSGTATKAIATIATNMSAAARSVQNDLNIILNSINVTGNQLGISFANGSRSAAASVSAMRVSVVNDLLLIQQEITRTAIRYDSMFSGRTNPNSKALPVSSAATRGGFAKGGYTGNIGTNQVAGVVHGKEFVMPAKQTAMYRPILESMRNGGTVGSSKASTATPTAQGVKVYIENYGSSTHSVEQLSENEIRIIATDVARRESSNMMARELNNPNSNVSKALQFNTRTKRRR